MGCMENKMQEQYNAIEAMEEDRFKLMAKFESWYLTLLDADEELIKDTYKYFHYNDKTVELMWIEFQEKAYNS